MDKQFTRIIRKTDKEKNKTVVLDKVAHAQEEEKKLDVKEQE